MNTRNLRFRSNCVRDIIRLFHEELDELYGAGEVGVFIEMLFEAFLGWDKVRLLTSKEQTIDQSDLLRFHWALEDLKQYRPIQHITGYTDFCGCRIEVNPEVLIPRPETEEIVQWIISNIDKEPLSILDLCTGSGCIAIALKKAFPGAETYGVDISAAALETARQNGKNNDVDVSFEKRDVLNYKDNLTSYDLIVSNPPYVKESEKAQMQRNVLEYDPAVALFVPDEDPLLFYKAIAKIAKGKLKEGGLLVVEINEALANETARIFREQGMVGVIHRDFRGKERWIAVKKSGYRDNGISE